MLTSVYFYEKYLKKTCLIIGYGKEGLVSVSKYGGFEDNMERYDGDIGRYEGSLGGYGGSMGG